MKLIRNIQDNKISRLTMPLLAALFVFSLSFHNHAFGENTAISIDSHCTHSHSADDCSACLLQGNLQVPKIELYVDNNFLSIQVAYFNLDLVITDSLITLDHPSRAPPTV